MKKLVCAIALVCLMIPALATGNSFFSETNEPVVMDIGANTGIPASKNDITIVLEPASVFYGVDLRITNEGTQELQEILWSFRGKPVVTGTGLIRQSQSSQGSLSELGSGETEIIRFRPFSIATPSPVGVGNTYLNASVHVAETRVVAQQRTNHLFFLLYNYRDTYMDIPPAIAYQMILDGAFDLIIDVVGLDIYSLGHLPGAVNYVWADGTLNSEIPTLDKEGTYLVYCHTDPPSTDGAQSLIDAGIKNVYRLEGNYRAWVDAGYPTEP